MTVFPEDRYIQVGDIKTRYWSKGRRGAPVLLIHGIGGYVESWTPTFEALALHHRVLAVDLPGHGRTDKPLDLPYTIEYLAGFVAEFMDALKLRKAHIVGHSLGGAISTRLTLRHPHLVDRLALVGSAGLGKEGSIFLRLATIPGLGELFTRPSLAGSRTAIRMGMHEGTTITEEMIQIDFAMNSIPGAQQAFLRTLRANVQLSGQKESMYVPNTEELPTIRRPLLAIWGKQDHVIPADHASVVAKALPGAKLHLMDRCGHLPMFEHTEEFNRTLLAFLEGQAARSFWR
ncbi:MAG: alpha/beta fold hydrolase [Leptospirales bacterium]|nr:alpha/beta fold hydrolase [Leptospirales bacterium]